MVEIGDIPPQFHPGARNEAMLRVQFDDDVLRVQPQGPITREDVATLTRTANEYLVDNSKIAGVMVETRTFPGFASVGAFADYARFIANHHAHVRRLALVTNSALAPVAEFMAKYVVGMEMRHFRFAAPAAALAWLRAP
jgi:hypothetical protein